MRLFENYTRKSPITTKLKTWISETSRASNSYYSHWSIARPSQQGAPCECSLIQQHICARGADFERSDSSHHCHCQTHSTASHFWVCSWAGCFLAAGWFRWLRPACCCRAAGVRAAEGTLGHCPHPRCSSCHHHFLMSSQSLRNCSHCCCSSVQ